MHGSDFCYLTYWQRDHYTAGTCIVSRFNSSILQYEGQVFSYCGRGRKVLLVPCRYHINIRLSTCVFIFHTEIGLKVL